MSASALAAARLRHGIERSKTSNVWYSESEQERIRVALQANDSGPHALPEEVSFEPLLPCGVDVPLFAAAALVFSSHTTYQLPCEDSQRGYDTVHRFSILGSKWAMNDGLKTYAMFKERKARRSADMPDGRKIHNEGLPPPEQRSSAGLSAYRAFEHAQTRKGSGTSMYSCDTTPSSCGCAKSHAALTAPKAGVYISNNGGFQSYPDLFDYQEAFEDFPALGSTWEEHAAGRSRKQPRVRLNDWGRAEFTDEDVQGRRYCHQLHGVCSIAIDEIQRVEGGGRTGGDETHAANAWLNVNRGQDINMMHRHCATRWSGTYYVSGGSESAQKLDGRLLFRTGPKRRAGGQQPLASHSFMTVSPVPGTLWLFPGSIPHRVLGMIAATDVTTRGMWAPRISVAMNFVNAEPWSPLV